MDRGMDMRKEAMPMIARSPMDGPWNHHTCGSGRANGRGLDHASSRSGQARGQVIPNKQAEVNPLARWKDAPPRPPWLAKLPWRSRQSWLLRSHLQDRIGTMKDPHARSLMRAFLGAYDKFHGGGNIAGMELEVSPVPDDPRACLHLPGHAQHRADHLATLSRNRDDGSHRRHYAGVQPARRGEAPS